MLSRHRHAQDMDSERLFQARLAEHVSARDEMLGAISNQHLALTFGTAAISGLFAAGFTQKGTAAAGIFLAVPVLSAWVLLMWLAEVVRMLRAVKFCRDQAALIARIVPVAGGEPGPIHWEVWRDKAGTITWTYLAVPSVMVLAYVVSTIRGLHVAHWHAASTHWVAAGFAAMLLVLLLFVGWTFVKWASPDANVGSTKRVGGLAQRLRRAR